MRTSWLFLTLLSCGLLRHGGEASLCKQSVIDAIHAYWATNVPTNVIQTAKSIGQERVFGTTANYYSDDVRCCYSTFDTDEEGDKVLITDVYKSGEEKTNIIYLKEEAGTTYELNSDVVRYRVVQNDQGVTALYKCNREGVEGEAEGVIKVRAADYDPCAVLKAKQILNNLGINIVTEYTSSCP